jgi:hypothetical protein
MNRIAKALALLAISGVVSAGDLVLKLGTAQVPVYHRIPITGTVTISPTTGDVTVDPVAEAGTSLDGWCPAGGGGGTPAPVVSNFVATPSSLPAGGGSVQLTWSVTNSTGCSGTSSPTVAGWNGSVSTGATVNLTSSGTYTFSLSCTGAGGTSSTINRQVTVANTTTPTACTNRPPPTGLTRQGAMVNNPRFAENNEFNFNVSIPLTGYSPILGAFPAAGQSAYVFIDTDKYVAMEFSTTGVNNGVFGEVSWEQPATNGAPLWAMISECPGDFEFVTSPLCKSHGGASGLTWIVGVTNNWGCRLEPNKTYYLNAVYATTTSWTNTSCRNSDGAPLSNCHWFINGAGRESATGIVSDKR